MHLHPHEGERVLATAAVGGLLLTLARQVRTHMPPAPVDGGIVGCSVRRWLTMHIYSSWQVHVCLEIPHGSSAPPHCVCSHPSSMLVSSVGTTGTASSG